MAHVSFDAHSYATYDNAVKELDRALALIGCSRANTRWLISVVPVIDTHRFVPCVIVSGPRQSEYLGLLHIAKVCLIS
jgi:hypothetical protein